MKTLYATLFDRSYIPRALCLYRSFAPWLGGGSRFGFFCLDDEAAALLERLDLPHAAVVRHAEFASAELQRLKQVRQAGEYAWTCKPAAVRHTLDRWLELDWAIYIDADMMAFADPDVALDSQAHVLLTPHRFALPHFAAYQPFAGTYNAGYIAFRNSPAARAALDWWMERCLELCPAIPVNGVHGDQTYLNQMPTLFAGVVASSHKGLNAAPWNIDGVRVAMRDGRVQCDDDPLLLYHFQGMRLYGLHLYDLYAGPYRLPVDAVRHIYRPHLQALVAATREVRRLLPGYSGGLQPFLTAPRAIYHQLRRALIGTNNLSLVLG